MSFDLAVLALTSGNGPDAAREMFERCLAGKRHVPGEPDERIGAFYNQLQAIYPDHGPAVDRQNCPWSAAPLDVGVDHVIMHMGFGSGSRPTIEHVVGVAGRQRLRGFEPRYVDTTPACTPGAW